MASNSRQPVRPGISIYCGTYCFDSHFSQFNTSYTRSHVEEASAALAFPTTTQREDTWTGRHIHPFRFVREIGIHRMCARTKEFALTIPVCPHNRVCFMRKTLCPLFNLCLHYSRVTFPKSSKCVHSKSVLAICISLRSYQPLSPVSHPSPNLFPSLFDAIPFRSTSLPSLSVILFLCYSLLTLFLLSDIILTIRFHLNNLLGAKLVLANS